LSNLNTLNLFVLSNKSLLFEMVLPSFFQHTAS
jgi:hypothetical protein